VYGLFARIDPEGLSVGSDGSELAWGESYLLSGFLSAYEATGDTVFLGCLCNHAYSLFLIRDDMKGLTDEVRGRVMPAWGSTEYSEGKRYAWIVHAGMVTFPLARFVYLVRRDRALSEQFGSRAEYILSRVRETVTGFDEYFRRGPGPGEGYYVSTYRGHELPLNHQNSIGRTFVALWLATGEGNYRMKAVSLARYFRNRLRYDSDNDAYDWPYSPGNDLSGEESEDVSHAAINADFAFQCWRAGIVFTRSDMRRFAGTVVRGFARGDSLSACIDGSGGFDPSISLQAGRWLHFAYIEPMVAVVLYRHLAPFIGGNEMPFVTSFFTVALFDEVRSLEVHKENPAVRREWFRR